MDGSLAPGSNASRFTMAALIALSAACALSACARSDSGRGPDSAIDTGFRGVVISPPYPKPDFTLTDFNGRPFDFRKETQGEVALLFFGYTHCPDVCPLHAANVAAVLRLLAPRDRETIRFVFVSTDPERDTPARLKEWLGNFDPGFVGLTGSIDEINRILAELRMPPVERDPKTSDSASYLVGHGAQVVAFAKDGMARTEYPFGIRQEDWAHDLPKLARGDVPNAPSAGATPGAVVLRPLGDSTAIPAPFQVPIQVVAAVVPSPATASEGALYLVLRNSGVDDTLTGVWSDAVTSAAVHQTTQGNGGMTRMAPVAGVVVRGGHTLQLAPGGTHVMLVGFKAKPPAAGESIPVTLRFRHAGDILLAADVVPYTEVAAILERAVAAAGK
jgi:protein SCO1